MNILQQIISDHINDIASLNIRPAVLKNALKMMHCGDSSFGGALFQCPNCDHLKFVPFRCHSRFCPSCGIKYAMDRTAAMSYKLINCTHRHCVFTIDQSLRSFFRKDRSLLNCLFSAVRNVLLRMFHKINKQELFTPGFVLVLHTFGRDLKWNPHIHCLITEGGMGNSGLWKKVSHFPYKFLRYAFQTVLLNLLDAKLGPSFKKIKSGCYKNHKDGFYVYAKNNRCNVGEVTKYIGRYLGRPVIATSRIDAYKDDMVTFHYNRHEDDKRVVETIPVMDFIKRLIIHIPDENFKQIRYYGIYARQREVDQSLVSAVSPAKKNYLISMDCWRYKIMTSFGYDPLCCPHCNTTMQLINLHHNHHRIPFIEAYLQMKEVNTC